jgi:polar amino acid transport system substrate-binding protein
MSATAHRRPRVRAAAALVALTALLLTGCGSGDDEADTATPGSGGETTAVDSALAERVPEDIKADGTLTVGTDATYAPNEFLDTDGQTVVGFDVDLFNAVAQRLGLEVDWTPAPFDAIITGVSSAKYDIGVSSFTVNPERMAQANMVTYFNAGTQWSAKAGNPTGITPDNACGKRVAVQRGTVQVEDITAKSKACTDAGQPAITIDQYAGQDQATAAVVSGKDDAGLADSPVMAYAVQQTNGQLELLGEIYDAAPYGYVVNKSQTEFAEVLGDAVQSLIDDGTYLDVLSKWGVEAGAVTESVVNPAS